MSFDACVRVELSTVCSACGSPAQVNAVREQMQCETCEAALELGHEFWHDALIELLPKLSRLAPGDSLPMERSSAQREIKMLYARTELACDDCKQPLPPLPDGLAGPIFCTACGAPSSVRPAPDFLRAMHPALAGVVGEVLDGAATSKPTAEGVTIHCASCGANLPVDGSSREVRCTYCSGDNFLPDSIWARLKPTAVVRPWYLLLDYAGGVGVAPNGTGSEQLLGIAADAGEDWWSVTRPALPTRQRVSPASTLPARWAGRSICLAASSRWCREQVDNGLLFSGVDSRSSSIWRRTRSSQRWA